MAITFPIRSDAMAILTTADVPDRDPRYGRLGGISGAYRADMVTRDGAILPVIVKHDGVCDQRVEALAFAVADLTPGLANVPPTVYRFDASASVQAFVPGVIPASRDRMAEYLASDIRGLAAFDLIVNNGDRHPGNALILPTGHNHHDRIVAIDHGFAFDSRPDRRFAVGAVAGQRIPHYLHNHADRIVAGTDRLRAVAVGLGIPASVADGTISRARRFATMRTFPDSL
jgi:hypothetical protein